jgi:hypothetical protein
MNNQNLVKDIVKGKENGKINGESKKWGIHMKNQNLKYVLSVVALSLSMSLNATMIEDDTLVISTKDLQQLQTFAESIGRVADEDGSMALVPYTEPAKQQLVPYAGEQQDSVSHAVILSDGYNGIKECSKAALSCPVIGSALKTAMGLSVLAPVAAHSVAWSAEYTFHKVLNTPWRAVKNLKNLEILQDGYSAATSLWSYVPSLRSAAPVVQEVATYGVGSLSMDVATGLAIGYITKKIITGLYDTADFAKTKNKAVYLKLVATNFIKSRKGQLMIAALATVLVAYSNGYYVTDLGKYLPESVKAAYSNTKIAQLVPEMISNGCEKVASFFRSPLPTCKAKSAYTQQLRESFAKGSVKADSSVPSLLQYWGIVA